MRSRTGINKEKDFTAFAWRLGLAFGIFPALARTMGAIKLSDCLFPPHAQPCNLFLYLAARHVTFVSQLYFIVLFVFFCKKIRVF